MILGDCGLIPAIYMNAQLARTPRDHLSKHMKLERYMGLSSVVFGHITPSSLLILPFALL